MKFSIIVPVYNVEKYLSKCLDSIINQTNQDFEIIIVNDGSTDNSQQIIDKYVEKHPNQLKSFIKENGGLSDARNYGIERATGEYILFIDSDDYIDENLLETIDKAQKKYNGLDVIGYNLVIIDEQSKPKQTAQLNADESVGATSSRPENEQSKKIATISKGESNQLSGEEAIKQLVSKGYYFEPACGYCYRLNFWKENNFSFMKGLYHEDFALIPLVVLKAKKVSLTNFDGYYYVQTKNSITRDVSKEKEEKRLNDILVGYDFLTKQLENIEFSDTLARDLFMSYLAKSLIYKLGVINKEQRKKYKEEIKKRNVMSYVVTNSLKEKIRKMLNRIKYRI